MLDLPEEWLAEVRRILGRHVPACEVRAYGSRVTGRALRYSDLDLAIAGKAPLAPEVLDALREDFSSSDIPILVEISDWQTLSNEFREEIEKGYKQI